YGRQMIDGARLVLGEQRLDGGGVADICFCEAIARARAHRLEIFKRARIGQLVDDENIFPVLVDQIPGQRRADKARPSGDENYHFVSLNSKSRVWSFNSGKVLSFSERIAFSGDTVH